MLKVLVMVAALTGSTIAASPQPPPSGEEARAVSMIQLIANPDRYEGRLVRLIGVAHFAMEESALYLHREDAETLNSNNAVWLGASPGLTEEEYKALSGAFVVVEGRFTAKAHGHLGAFPGELESVRRLQRISTRSDYNKQRKQAPK